jgi:CDP-glycerol glycerophosphotransferase
MKAGPVTDRAKRLARSGLHRLPTQTQRWARAAARRTGLIARSPVDPLPAAPLVSIVLPVFGVEKYLSACLDSLLGQTYQRLQVVAVDDGSPDDSISILRERADRDPRLEIVRQANAGLGAARNRGVRHARGRYLMFVDSDDLLKPDAVASYEQSLRSTGSDFVVGGYQRIRAAASFPAAPWLRAAHETARQAITLADFPDIQVNAVAWSKMYQRQFWDDQGLKFPVGVLYEDQAVSARAYARARHFDVLSAVTYQWRVREDNSSISQQDLDVTDLTARFTAAFASLAELETMDAHDARDTRLVQLLSNDFPLSIRASQHAEGAFWEVLRNGLDRLRAETGEAVWQQVPPQHRVAIRLVSEGRRDALFDFISLQRNHVKHSTSLVVDGKAYVQFRTSPVLAVAPHDPLLALTAQQTSTVTGVRRFFWRTDGRWEIHGWVYIDNVDLSTTHPEITLLLSKRDDLQGPVIEIATVGTPDPEVTARSKHQHANYENGVFRATFDPALLRAHGAGGRWSIHVRIRAHGLDRTGPLRGVQHSGSAGHLAGRLVPAGHLEFRETVGRGLTVTLRKPVCVLEHAELHDRVLDVTLRPEVGVILSELEVTNDVTGMLATTTLTSRGGLTTGRLELPVTSWDADSRRRQPWTVRVISADARRAPVALREDLADPVAAVGLRLRMTQFGNFGLVEDRRTLIVDSLQSRGGEQLHLTGRAYGFDDDRTQLELLVQSPRGACRALLAMTPDSRFSAVLDLAEDPWGLGDRPLASGRYTFKALSSRGQVETATESVSVQVRAGYAVIATLPLAISSPRFRAEVQLVGNDRLLLHVEPPLLTDERGARPQRTLKLAFAGGGRGASDLEPGAVLFRSYYGEICGCNPRAVHEELRRRETSHTLYWAVRDHSVAVPEGGVAVIHESAEWYRLLQEAEYYVDNMHQPIHHRKPAHQIQVQTFHGYPFKAMGLTHWKHQRRDLAHIRSYLERAADWDFLVSPATYATELLRAEFGFPHEVLAIGYPRNDVLQGPRAAEIRDRVRRQLGIRPEQTAVLYAPTFRDDLAQDDLRASMTDFLDVPALAASLGEDYLVMVRGHAFHARVSARVEAGVNVVDLTDYPDINDLCLASDCAVLDYSSLRFDYALTGKPMVYLVPDLEQYVTRSRGTLLAFGPTAPGPLVETTSEVADALKDLSTVRLRYAQSYATFRRNFLDLDDGHAAERLVERVFLR